MNTVIQIGSPLLYTIFAMSVLVMVMVDVFALKHSGDHKVSVKEALIWTLIWITVALLFNLWLWWYLAYIPIEGMSAAAQSKLASAKALEYLTGYVLEKSLSIDNIFVFLLIFNFFKVPAKYQRRVLVYGVLMAIFLRIVMVLIGAALISNFEWILYVFGGFLIYTGFTMFKKEKADNLENNRLLQLLKRSFRFTHGYHKEYFFIREKGLLYATPLFLVLMMINFSDIIFAVDSVPAVFAITKDPFIVMTSNIFAILGLRAMYFLLADIADRFYLLKYGLAVILIFIGSKMLLMYKGIHIPTTISLSVVLGTLILSVVLSLWINPKKST